MSVWWLIAALVAAHHVVGDEPTLGAAVNSQGVTEILGNSFGQPGYNLSYDYIIVGGGNAGNTIAARLAMDPANYSVAVIEAGSFYEILDGNRTQIPGYNWINTLDFPIGKVSTQTMIGLNTVPQAGYDDREVYYIAPQTFGGGSAANYMGYHRPTVGAMDEWAKLVDDDFWNWKNVYPAYKKSCNFSPPDYNKIDKSYNITWDQNAFVDGGGPLHVSYGNYFGPSGPALQEAMEGIGLKSISGLNSGKLLGYGAMTAAIDLRTSTRDTSESSFLQTAARQSKNLKIYPNTQARRVIFDDSKRATGVEVKANLGNVDLNFHLNATKEVILSAGVWHSPQILMVSGVGPAETLKEHGIEVVADLPGVGQNEWDQALAPIVLQVNVSTNTQFQAGNTQEVKEALSAYLNDQSGLLSGVGAGLAVGYEKFPDPYRSEFSNSTLEWLDTFPNDWPEVEYIVLENIPITEFEGLLGSISTDMNFLLVNAVLLTTKSRGNMTISSNDISDQPVISPNWLLEDADVEQAYAAFMRMREFEANCSVVVSEAYPGNTTSTREEIISYLRENMNHLFHGASTCKMGTSHDKMAVIDSRARVFNVKGLRVVDASSFPVSPPGHPMSSVYMLAEKIAESILQGD